MSFDRIASSYRFLESIAFCNVLQRARTAFIPQTVDSRLALVVGEGDGRFLAELLRTNPRIQVDCVDASKKMLRLARARAAVIPSKARDLASIHKQFARSRGPSRTGIACAPRVDPYLQFGEASRVQFHRADILDWIPPRSYDLVVTHFFLDCFDREQLSGLIAKLAYATVPRSRWMVADFAIPPNGFRRVYAKIWLRTMYSFFHTIADLKARELVDPSLFIQETGFQLRREIVTRLGLVKTQLWERDRLTSTLRCARP